MSLARQARGPARAVGMTLRAGDVVLTSTPSGIGNAREPAVFLAPADEVVTRGGPLSELRNRIEAGQPE